MIDWPTCDDCKRARGRIAVMEEQDQDGGRIVYPTGQYICPECAQIRDAASRLESPVDRAVARMNELYGPPPGHGTWDP